MFSSRSRMDRTQEKHEHRQDHSRSSRKSTDRIRSKRFNYLSNLKTLQKQFSTTRQPQPSVQLHHHPSNDLLEQGKRHYKQNNLRKALGCFLTALTSDEHNVQLNYMLGMCFLTLEKFQRAAECFKVVLKQAPTYKRNLFLLLSICHKKLDRVDKALECISGAFEHYPAYLDAYIYRAKLNMKLKRYEDALKDFEVALGLEGGATVMTQASKSDCLKFLNRLEDALVGYSHCLKLQPRNYGVLLKRAICNYQLNNFPLAKKDLQVLVEKKQGGSDAYYFRAMIELKSVNLVDASLYFSEAITENTSSKAVAKSIEELAIIKIQARDFYEAYEVLKRSQFIDPSESTCIDRLRGFVEAVIFLMKRKFQEAEESFRTIETDWFEHPRKNSEFLLPYFHSYRAYGLFCVGQHNQAFECYNRLKWPLEDGCQYNRSICEGLLAYNRNDKSGAEHIFERLVTAPKLVRMEPYFYLAVIHIQESIQTESSENILRAVQLLTEGLQISELSNLYYYRALVYLFLSMNTEALEDIDKAIEKSQDNIPKYFYIRGLIFAMEGNFKQAINDLSTCISLDEGFHEAYVERAKCYMLENELMLAYSDLEQIPNNRQWIAMFFIHNNQFEDAYQLIDPEDTELFEMVALRLGKWQQAGVSGKLCLAILESNVHFPNIQGQIDKLLESAVSTGISIGYFQQSDLLMLRGYSRQSSDPAQSIEYYRQALLMMESVTYDDSSAIEEQYNEIKITQAKLNIVFALLDQGKHSEAAQLLVTMKEETAYMQLKYKMEELTLMLRGQFKLNRSNFFNEGEMLSRFLPERQVTINGINYTYKPYVSFPLMPLPPIASAFDHNILRGFTLEHIENKPEAPWIRRLPQGIVFTDQVQIFEHLKLETSECQQNEHQEQEEQEDDASDTDQSNKLEKLKQDLRLDSKVEEKLNRLTSKATDK